MSSTPTANTSTIIYQGDYCGHYLNISTLQLNWEEEITISVYWLALIIPGVCLNLLTLVAILNCKVLRRITSNRYIVILSIVDLSDILIIGGSTVTKLSKVDSSLCWIIMWGRIILGYTRFSMLGVIALDRYRMVVRVTHYRDNRRFKTSVCVGLLAPILYVCVFVAALEGTNGIFTCYDDASRLCIILPIPNRSHSVQLLHGVIFLADPIIYLVLQSCVAYGYVRVVLALRGTQLPWGRRASHRSVEMMITVCASSILAVLPQSLFSIITQFVLPSSFEDYGHYKWISWVYHISTVTNPLIYIFFNKRLLNEIKNVLSCYQSSPTLSTGASDLEKHH